MTSTTRATGRTWLKPSSLAKATGGKLVRSGRPARRMVTDSRTLQPGDGFVALPGERHDGHDHLQEAFARGAAGAVISCAVDSLAWPDDVFQVRVENSYAALLAIAAEHRRRHEVTVVAVTGSCGKTSTKDMLGRVLASTRPTVSSPASFNNHVGVPLSLLQIEADTRAAVIEIGTNARGEVAALSRAVAPDIGIVTCVGEAHLSGLGSLAGVAEEKAGIFACMPPSGVAILNGDDASCRDMAQRCEMRCVFVGVGRETDWFATHVQFHGLGTSFLLQGELPVTLPRLGSHNVYNALLCIAAASELDMAPEQVLATLCQLQPSSRRMEHKQLAGITVFDDTYNMNPASARAALLAVAGLKCEGRKLVVFGEMLELGERSDEIHRQLGEEVARAGVDVLVSVGERAASIAEGAAAAGVDPGCLHRVPDPSHALDFLIGELAPRDLVLCKASRRVGLDRLVDGLSRHLSARIHGGAVSK